MTTKDDQRWICTKHYRCGRYRFSAYLPVIGRLDDTEQWTAAVDGAVMPARFDNLEDAMKAALSTADTTKG